MTRTIGKRLPTTLLRSPLFLSLTQLLGGLESLGRRGNKPRKVSGTVTSRDCKHNPFTHFPKDSDCAICNQGKKKCAQCRSKRAYRPDGLPTPLKFGDLITADLEILNEDDSRRESDRVALIVLDRFSRWLQGYACKGKTSSECEKFLKRFVGPQCKPEHVYSDCSKELKKACEDLEWPHDKSTPHRFEANGVIENSVKIVKEGTSCVLIQSGLDEKWWPQAMACYCFLRNVNDLLSDSKTSYESR